MTKMIIFVTKLGNIWISNVYKKKYVYGINVIFLNAYEKNYKEILDHIFKLYDFEIKNFR